MLPQHPPGHPSILLGLLLFCQNCTGNNLFVLCLSQDVVTPTTREPSRPHSLAVCWAVDAGGWGGGGGGGEFCYVAEIYAAKATG